MTMLSPAPSKPIGAFLDEETAQQCQQQLGWTLMEDAGRGWRRTVPSPAPLEIIEHHTIAHLVRRGISGYSLRRRAVYLWCETGNN